MRSRHTKGVIHSVLEETRYAYNLSCEMENSNADYAEYASAQALPSFRMALQDPDLTYEDLCGMLRRAAGRTRARQCKTPWSLFMAGCLERTVNHGNHPGTVN